MTRLGVFASIIAVGSATACIPIAADGAFRAQGEIVGASTSCELQLFRIGHKGGPLQRQPVYGVFLETFVVSSRPGSYRVDLWCNGSLVRSVAVRYEDARSYETPVQFGKIAL